MPSSVKNILMKKTNIDQIDEVDSIIDDFIDDTIFIDINGCEYKDDFEYNDNDFYSIVNNYDDEHSANFHYKIKTRESHTSFYSNICYFLSYLDFTKQIR